MRALFIHSNDLAHINWNIHTIWVSTIALNAPYPQPQKPCLQEYGLEIACVFFIFGWAWKKANRKTWSNLREQWTGSNTIMVYRFRHDNQIRCSSEFCTTFKLSSSCIVVFTIFPIFQHNYWDNVYEVVVLEKNSSQQNSLFLYCVAMQWFSKKEAEKIQFGFDYFRTFLQPFCKFSAQFFPIKPCNLIHWFKKKCA